jgi:hypothetical protein
VRLDLRRRAATGGWGAVRSHGGGDIKEGSAIQEWALGSSGREGRLLRRRHGGSDALQVCLMNGFPVVTS